MTLEEYLDCDASKLEAMTDEQILEHFKPYLNVTRPELATRPDKKPIKFNDKEYANSLDYKKKAAIAQALAQAAGINLKLPGM